jgi:hypothetical protein
MNRRDDKALDDAELTPYLEGRDGVSAAYRASSKEAPPAALDQAILQAARASLRQPAAPAKTASLRNYYSLAASLVLGMMLGTWVLNDTQEAPEVLTTSERTPIPVNDREEFTVVVEAPRETEAPVQAAPQSTAVRPPAPAIPAEPPAAVIPAIPEPATAVADATEAAETARAAVQPQEEQIQEEQSQGGQSQREQPQRQQPQAIAVDLAREEQLEEVMVTGARIRAEPRYRESRDSWVDAITALVEELQTVSGDPEPLIATLEEERDLFEQTYPDVDLDAAVAAQLEQ